MRKVRCNFLIHKESFTHDLTTELRARSALWYLELAIRGGNKAAAVPLMKVHGALTQLYRAQALQYRDMGSLPKE